MSKGLSGFFITFIALFVGALYYTDSFQSPFITSLNYIKSTYKNITEFIQNKTNEHFFQAQHIKELEQKLKQYEKNNLIVLELNSQLNDLLKINNSKLKTDPKVELVRTISYEKFGNFNRIWLEISDYNSSKIYGLVYKNMVAGIAINYKNKPLGLLNNDIKSSYAVYIGKQLAPGIAHGNDDKNLVVEFIPLWYKIKKGDEVITSGLDNIFFKGLKVGKVIDITSSQGYQNAVVKPYYQPNEVNYFHIIKRVK
jgi:rod shape-determining protein MreC